MSQTLRDVARSAGVADELLDDVAAWEPVLSGLLDGTSRGPVLVACDLDRTLIYSASACSLGSANSGTPTVVAELDAGTPMSFVSAHAAGLLEVLGRTAVLVPCTTRTSAQYARVRLPGPPPKWAVVANGGRILVDGVRCATWSCAVDDRLAAACVPLAEVVAHLESTTDPSWALRRRTAEDLFAYLVVDRPRVPADVLAGLAAWAEPRGWSVSVQGNKVYCVPVPLTKAAAAAEVARRAGTRVIASAGDSRLDVELLMLADVGVRPAHGELHDAGWTAAHVAVTPRSGLLGGQDVAAALVAAVLLRTVR